MLVLTPSSGSSGVLYKPTPVSYSSFRSLACVLYCVLVYAPFISPYIKLYVSSTPVVPLPLLYMPHNQPIAKALSR